MQLDIYNNDELINAKTFLSKFTSKNPIILNLISGGNYYWELFDIGVLINILKLAKEQGTNIILSGDFERADLARLLPYDIEIRSKVQYKAKNKAQEKYKIIITDYIVAVEVGAYNHEYYKKQKLCFNLCVETLKAKKSDNIEDVFSYDIILDAILSVTKANHLELLESLAEQVCDIVLTHPLVLSVNIRIEKLELINGAVGVELIRTK